MAGLRAAPAPPRRPGRAAARGLLVLGAALALALAHAGSGARSAPSGRAFAVLGRAGREPDQQQGMDWDMKSWAVGVGFGVILLACVFLSAKPPKKKVGSFKVCVCGGAGGIGQPLSLLMASNPHVSELSVFDLTIAMVPADGVAADLSHLETKCKVKGYAIEKDAKPIDKLKECLTGCSLVLVPAGLPRKPGMTRADLLGINAGIAKGIVEACAKFCPEAVIGLIVNPVNSVVPAMCELYKKKGLDARKICGVTSLDIVRANKFVHELTGCPLEQISVPVVGGHAGVTILPLFSQVPVCKNIDASKIPALDSHVQDAGTDVVNAKGGKGSATLSMAYAGAKFGSAVLAGLAGIPTTECAYVMRDPAEELPPYFASKVTFGPGGVSKVAGIGAIDEREAERMRQCIETLKGEIDAGLEYAASTQLAD